MNVNNNRGLTLPTALPGGSGGEQPTSVSGDGATVRLVETTHVVTTGAQTTPPAGLGQPSALTQPKSLESRTISAAAVQPKPRNFTFLQLEAICNGKYNMGEVALDEKGELKKINNHVHFCKKNTVVTTPEENALLRRQTYLCIADQYKDASPEMLSKVHDLLLGEGRETLSLSRDELGRLLKGIKDGELESKSADVAKDLKDIRIFKSGEWNNLVACPEADDELPNDKFVNRMKSSGLIKGLKTDPGNQVVTQFSINARRDVARSIAKKLMEPFTGAPGGKVDITKLRLIIGEIKVRTFERDRDVISRDLQNSIETDLRRYVRTEISKEDFAVFLRAAENELDAANNLSGRKCPTLVFIDKLFSETNGFLENHRVPQNEQPKVVEQPNPEHAEINENKNIENERDNVQDLSQADTIETILAAPFAFYEKIDDCEDLEQLSKLCRNAFRLPKDGVDNKEKANSLAEVRSYVAFKIGQIVKKSFLKHLDNNVTPDGKPIAPEEVAAYRVKLMKIDVSDMVALFDYTSMEEKVMSPKREFEFQAVADDIISTFEGVFEVDDE